MAEVSYLRLPEIVEGVEHEDIFTFDSAFPYWSSVFCSESDVISFNDDNVHQPDVFDPDIYDRIGGSSPTASGSGSLEEMADRENQVTFVMDLFQQRVEQSHVLEVGSFESNPVLESGFGIIDRCRDEIGGSSSELEIGDLLGLGPGFDGSNKGLGCADDDEDNFSGFIVSDCGDEFYVSRRERGSNSGANSTSDESEGEGNPFPSGLNAIGFDSDSEEDIGELLDTLLPSEDDDPAPDRDSDSNIALFWDSLHLDDHRDGNDEFEWEEVEGGMSVLNPEESISVLPVLGPEQVEIEENEQDGSTNLEWQVLLNVNNLERNLGMENNEDPHFGDHDDYTYTTEYEMTFGQFTEGEAASIGKPPASKSVVQNLPSITMAEQDLQNGSVICAVCKDEMGVGEQAKQLPCSHRYHGDCIIPWLGIRNTCPVCRYELPTDDPSYEQRRTDRGAHAQ